MAINFLSVEQVSKSYGMLQLFENVSFGINQGQKIGLVAKNGSGKTSLLNIITGKDSPDSGEVNFRKGLKVGYLAQEPELDANLSVEETIFAADNEALQAIKAYDLALKNPEDAEAYQAAFERMDQYQAWDFENQYQQILSKFKLTDLNAKVKSLSGGKKSV